MAWNKTDQEENISVFKNMKSSCAKDYVLCGSRRGNRHEWVQNPGGRSRLTERMITMPEQ